LSGSRTQKDPKNEAPQGDGPRTERFSSKKIAYSLLGSLCNY
jgi:hypothetical protein